MTTVFVYEHLSALGASRDHESRLAPSLYREGRAMLDAVSRDFAAISGVSVLSIQSTFELEFRQHAAQADYSLIIAPESDGVLETRCRWVEEEGGRLLGPSSKAVGLTGDKLELARHFEKHGVPTPRTWSLGNEPRDLLPIVWKPRDGAGSQSTFLIQSDGNAPMGEPGMIAQEFVPGFPASVAFLVGPKECVPLRACTQELSADGRFQYQGGLTPIDEMRERRAIKLARLAVHCVRGLNGYVGVDLVLGEREGEDRVIEINPRLTTSYIGLRRLASGNLAEAMLQVVRGESHRPLQWNHGTVVFKSG
ncbi:MAG: ATP-grasp domain-containing protein [Planctomycetes bacterium]|nr:ATP-grasp domain-containing protein [Planctomycetota bacterium]